MSLTASVKPAPRRRPPEGGYARGEETRLRIVEAALKVFGEEGYERASTRRIAEVAGVHPPALQYYFSSKEGLHRACAEHVLQRPQGLVEVLEDLQRRGTPESPAAAVEGVCAIMDALADLTCAEAPPGHTAFLARAQADAAGPALDALRTRLIEPLRRVTAGLVGVALGKDAGDDDVRLSAMLILAQASVLHSARHKTLAFLDWPDFEGDRRQRVKDRIRHHVKAVLGQA